MNNLLNLQLKSQLARGDSFNEKMDVVYWTAQTFIILDQPCVPLTLRIVDEAEITQLNQRYRQKNCPTNVLAFPFSPIEAVDDPYLGDIIICYPVVKSESEQNNIPLIHYFALILVHGVLHLLGYDHQTDEQTQKMEKIEQTILDSIFTPEKNTVKR